VLLPGRLLLHGGLGPSRQQVIVLSFSFTFSFSFFSSSSFSSFFSRTWRLSVLDSFMPLGFMVGLPLGTALKNACGPTIVFITGAVTVVIAMLYVLFFVKDNRGLVREGAVKPDTSEVLGKFPGCNRGDDA
jgi:hypothetical protein